MSALVVRDDLSQRTALSKSTLTQFDVCQQKAWFDIHDRRPVVPNEKMTFGSAVDAAVEQIAVFLRSGQQVEMGRVMAAAAEVVARDEVAVDLDEVERAAKRFVTDVAPKRDWSYVSLQPTVRTEIDGLGEIDTHPDIVYADNSIDDVKTSGRSKPNEPTLELGFYAIAREAETGKAVPFVGYLTWVRIGKPYWQDDIRFPVTDELRRWTMERSAAYIRAKRADEVLNRKRDKAMNWSFPGGPAWAGACDDCAYNPANGGNCSIAYRRDAA